jgi:hypothetical protein
MVQQEETPKDAMLSPMWGWMSKRDRIISSTGAILNMKTFV